MILQKFDIEAGALLIEVDGADCELLARICHEAEGSEGRGNRAADLALLFTLAATTCGIYGSTNADEQAQGYLRKRMERCAAPLDERKREGGE